MKSFQNSVWENEIPEGAPFLTCFLFFILAPLIFICAVIDYLDDTFFCREAPGLREA